MVTSGCSVFDVLTNTNKLKRRAAFKVTRQNHLRCKENYRDISRSNLLRGSAPHRPIGSPPRIAGIPGWGNRPEWQCVSVTGQPAEARTE